jgi:oxaloacetate decarboxylase alpha subunit
MDPNVKDKILNRPRGKELTKWQPPEPSIQELRRKFGGAQISDEEFLLRWLLTEEEITAMKAAGPPKEYLDARHPLITLLEELTKRKGSGMIRVKQERFSLVLEKREKSQAVE